METRARSTGRRATRRLPRSVTEAILSHRAVEPTVVDRWDRSLRHGCPDTGHRLLERRHRGVDDALARDRRLVRVAQAGELADLAGAGLGVEPLHVALLADLEGGGQVH